MSSNKSRLILGFRDSKLQARPPSLKRIIDKFCKLVFKLISYDISFTYAELINKHLIFRVEPMNPTMVRFK